MNENKLDTTHIQKAEEKYKAIISTSKEGFLITDLSGNILEVNKAYCKLTGYDSDELLKMNIKDLEAKSAETGVASKMEEITKNGGARFEDNHKTKEGKIIDLEISASCAFLDGNKILLVFTHDISDRKHFENKLKKSEEKYHSLYDELKSAEKAKINFVSLASHQLRTPLTDISLSSEMLIRGMAGDLKKEQKKYIKNIYEGVREMASLVDQLLNISRIELGTMVLDPKPIDVSLFINSVLKNFAMQIKNKKLSVRKNYDKNIPVINADERMIKLVVDNIISNAVKYSKKGGLILIRIKKQNKNLLMKISDAGIGIPESQKKMVFTKLFRAENAIKEKIKGTGLGLYIARSALGTTGGKIWFDSKENKGTTFYISIPIKK